MAYEDRIMRMAANRRRNEGIANPHIRERRLRSLRTPSQQTIGPVGREPLSVAEAAYHRGNVGRGRRTLLDSPGDWMRRNKHTLETPMSDARRMVKDLAPTNVNDLYNKWLASQQGVLPYYFNQPPGGAVDVTGRPTMPPEMYESISTNEGEHEGWRIGENPAFGQKQWNPDDIEGQTWGVDYTSDKEERPWEVFLNAVTGGLFKNRGGIMSLKR